MGANGNGKIDERLLQAQRVLTKRQEPLADLDRKIAKLKEQLAAVYEETAAAEAEHKRASQNYVDTSTPATKQRLMAASAELQPLQTKIEVLNDRISAYETQRDPLNIAVQEASAVLAEVGTEVRLEVLAKEKATAKYRAAEHETARREWERRYQALDQEEKTLLYNQREATWRAGATQRAANFKAANPNNASLREPSVRQGF